MSQKFYQENEKVFLQLIEDFNNSYKQYAFAQQKGETLEKMKTKLNQANDKLKCMKVQYKDASVNPQLQKELTPKLKQNNEKYNECEQKLNAIESQVSQQNTTNESTDPRRKVEKITNQISNQKDQLEQIHIDLENTNAVSINIQENLKNQKEKLLKTTEDVQIINGDTKQINRLAKLMQNREMFGKLIKISLIGILTIGNLLLIYYKCIS